MPYESGAASYDLKKQARCITALEGDTDNNTFLLASLALHGGNEVHVLEFNEDTNEVWCPIVYSHPQEVWGCGSCPAAEHAELLLTTHSDGSQQRTTLWRMDGLADRELASDLPQRAAPKPRPMSELCHLGSAAELGDCRAVLWNSVLPDQVASIHRASVRLWQLSHAAAASSAAETGSAPAPTEGAQFGCGRWDPHHAHALGLGCERDLFTLDTRSMKVAVGVKSAHEGRVRGLDFNPNKPNTLLSSGDDYHIRVWDLRRPVAPVMAQNAHAHWVTCASYNRFHDQARVGREAGERRGACGRWDASYSGPYDQ
jgi:hypothetical protein